jgi:hypothetical protein
MILRGQSTGTLRKRRATILVLLLLLIVIVPLSFYIHKQVTRPPLIKILWQYEFSDEMMQVIMHPRDQGGVTVLGTKELAIFDSTGNLLTPSSSPVPGSHYGNNPGPAVDGKGNAYFTRQDSLVSYDTFGKKRWEVRLPNANTGSNGSSFRLAFARVSSDDKILVALTSGEFTKLDTDGQVLLHTQCDPNLNFFSAPIELPGSRFIAITLDNSCVMGHDAVIVGYDGSLLWKSDYTKQIVNEVNIYNDVLALWAFGGHVYFINNQC